MFDAVRRATLRALRVPHAPSPPDDSGGTRVFRASRQYFRYLLAVWGLRQLGALAGLVGTLVLLRLAPDTLDPLRTPLTWLEALAWLAWLAQLPVTYATLRLDFEMRWYIVTGRALRIREGVWSVREKTMTFANVQQMTVKQGPLQRLLGISDLEVRTAGGGSGIEASGHGAGGDLHVALLRGVDDAAAVRDLVRERVRQHRDAGLGDPDDPEHEPEPAHVLAPSAVGASTWSVDTPAGATPDGVADLLAAARELRAAVRG